MKFEDGAGFSALAFKVANDPFVGSLTFIRIILVRLKLELAFITHPKKKRRE